MYKMSLTPRILILIVYIKLKFIETFAGMGGVPPGLPPGMGMMGMPNMSGIDPKVINYVKIAIHFQNLIGFLFDINFNNLNDFRFCEINVMFRTCRRGCRLVLRCPPSTRATSRAPFSTALTIEFRRDVVSNRAPVELNPGISNLVNTKLYTNTTQVVPVISQM